LRRKPFNKQTQNSSSLLREEDECDPKKGREKGLIEEKLAGMLEGKLEAKLEPTFRALTKKSLIKAKV
jgi:hypothetical protein